jgi:eukaryotic-like serine/threonine-protein kinase
MPGERDDAPAPPPGSARSREVGAATAPLAGLGRHAAVDSVAGPGEPTYAEPDQQNTIDALSPRARRVRAEAISTAKPANPAPADDARAPGMCIGRYQLLEMVGAGGMGMVWGAWDPELERRVALKLVQPLLDSRERILAEGQALAKLSHPNVVPIYDVGVMGEQVYLVMEWVRGITLRAFARKAASRRAVLDAYRQAGEGLAAAHRAGIVHRDFKPDNAICGDDGRVRVLDFGLAQAAAASGQVLAQGSEPQRVSGTPHYMAPEQMRGEVAVAATDQYSFCVSLSEALTELTGRKAERGAAKLPSWISASLQRGLAAEASRRFSSMDELLAALARDPARVWRRRALVVGVVASAATAFAVGRLRSEAAHVEPCAGSVAELASSWSPAIRDGMVAHLRGLGPLGAEEAARIGGDLDSYGGHWIEQHRRSCLARERNELTPTLYERRLSCLARAKASLAAVAELLGAVPVEGLPAAVVASRELPDATVCAGMDDSAVLPPPPAVAARVAAIAPAIERARVRGIAAHPEALGLAKVAVADATATGYAPLIARALLTQGRIEASLFQSANPTLGEALRLALSASDDALAAEAYARWIFGSEFQDLPDGWHVMMPIAERLGSHGRFARALLWNNLGARYYRAGQLDKARATLHRALAETTLETDPASVDIELVAILSNLSLTETSPEQRQAFGERTTAAYESTLGRNHPATIGAREQAAMKTRDPVQARAQLEEVCEGWKSWTMTINEVVCAFEVAWIADDLGDRAAAARWMKIAVTDPSTAEGERVMGKIAAEYAAIAAIPDGDGSPGTADSALAQHVVELQQLGKAALDTQAWKFQAADAYMLAARLLDRLHRQAEATAAWRLALAALDGLDAPVFERRVARVRAALAERLRHRDPAVAKQLATAALAWYRVAGGYAAAIARLEPIATAL